jgi:hypothetical protein
MKKTSRGIMATFSGIALGLQIGKDIYTSVDFFDGMSLVLWICLTSYWLYRLSQPEE